MQKLRTKPARVLMMLALVGGLVFATVQINYAQDMGGTTGGSAPVITDQFNTVTSGALQARRPGLQISASQNVSVDDFDTEPFEEDTEFVQDTINVLILQIIEVIDGILSTLSLAVGGNPFGGGGLGGGGLGGLFDSLTGGLGSIPIS